MSNVDIVLILTWTFVMTAIAVFLGDTTWWFIAFIIVSIPVVIPSKARMWGNILFPYQ